MLGFMRQKLNRIPVIEIQSAFSRTGFSCSPVSGVC